MADSDSSAFMSGAGCSDSFVSVRQNKLDTDSHSIGTAEGIKNSDHVLTKENSFKSSPVCKTTKNEGYLQKQTSSPHYHDYYPSGPFSESSKEDLVLPLAAQGIKDEGAESSNGICSKHDEEIASETQVLPMGNGDVNFHQASTSSSKQTKLTDTTETENTTQSLESNLDDESNTYENITVSENKEQNIFSTEENEIKRGSNISTKSTSSSGSDSSTDSVTYESPDEGAQHENGNFFREEEYYCEHPKYIERNLQNNPPGTFLICNIRSKQVMCLVTDDGIKRFIIHRHEENLSLFKDISNTKNTFPSLNKLLSYYHEHDLPSNNFTERLKRAYKAEKED
ncbi:uncharacterized protein LOC132730010 [Ruditapes philippinarum]|uniref:uncharacterized protein LOC132730010 n=1 Tax=Ruditapes philippinarum TaxID=129788 RepID=UPI00295A5DBB|nr:uncharacterized protein LOC132730010 [Ruditapes philippinarum]